MFDQNLIKKNQNLLSYMITCIGSIMLVITLCLPFASATDAYKEYLVNNADEIYSEQLHMKNHEAVDISFIEFAKMYYTAFTSGLSQEVSIICFVVICIFACFAIFTMLFSFVKKPIAIIICNSIAFTIFRLLKWDFEDRGVIPTSTYDWGFAQYVCYVGIMLVFIGAIWMFIIKRKYKIKKKENKK